MTLEALFALVSALRSAVDRLYSRILMSVGRGILTLINDAGQMQIIQVQLGSGELSDDVPRVMEYGFTSVPHPGAHAIAIFIGGDRSNGAVIATNDLRYRLAGLQPGETAIYDDLGQKVHLTREGIRLFSPISYQWDVGGYGQKVTALGGNAWQIDNYTTGATVTTNNNPIEPPEIS